MSDAYVRLASPSSIAPLRALVAASSDPAVIVDAGAIVVGNDAAAGLFGYESGDQLAGGRILEHLAPPDRPAFEAAVCDEPGRDPAAPITLALTGRRCDDSEVDVQVRVARIEGTALSLCSFVPSRSLGSSEDFYRALFEGNSAVKLLIAPDDGRIIDANPAAAALYGWPLDVLRTMRITDLNTATPEVIHAEMQAARTRSCGYFRFRHRTARGKILHVDIHSGPVEIAGKLFLLSIVHDVTDRDELEEQLRRTDRLDSIGRLAGGIAHDFNNLLTVMLSSTSFLARKLPRDSPLSRHVADLSHAAGRAAELTSGLLAFGGGQIMSAAPFDLNAVVGRTAQLIARTIGPSIEVRTDFDPALDAALGDSMQIEQVVMNLALNARDAMPKGGVLTMHTSMRDVHGSLDLVGDGRWVSLSVEDTGEGMDDEVRARIFEPFYTTKAAGEGTGLGLARAYGIVSQSGGHITVHSAPGRGAEFVIYLPRAVDKIAARPPSPPAMMPGVSSATVLLVDDLREVRLVLGECLEEAGYRVLQAASAEEALELEASELDRVDVLVSDVVMPGRSGVDLAAQLLAERPQLRVVLMSGNLGDERSARLPRDAAFLHKPFAADDLVVLIAGLLEGDAAGG